jgi:probable phosphoglycerate mutase
VRENRFWLIRHAESTWNAAGRWQGQSNPPLSARGRAQAVELARLLAGEGVEVLIASDLARTAETATIVGRRLGLLPRLEPGLREIDAGSWAGLARSEIARRDGAALARFDGGDPDVRAGGAECRRDVAERARRALQAIDAEHDGRCLAVVTHAGVVRSLLPGVRLGHTQWQVVGACELQRAHGSAT